MKAKIRTANQANDRFWEFRNMADGQTAELLLYGDIASDSWLGDEIVPQKFAEDLKALGDVDEITVRINSPGGDVFAAQAIGNYLESHAAKVTARIDGLCASAATIIACHCDKVVAARDSIYMIHPVQMGIVGYVGADDLENYSNAIAAIRQSIVGLYARKTGRKEDEVAQQMDETSWWTGQEAMDNGFVDELTDEGNAAAIENRAGLLFVNGISANLPFEKAPEFVQKLQTVTASGFANMSPAAQPGDKSHKEVNSMAEITNVEDLRAAYPDLVQQIENNAVTDERNRIQEIEDMALPGSEELTNEAKFVNPVSASDYAKAAVKRAKAQGANYLNSVKLDANQSGLNSVANQEPTAQKDDKFLDAIRKSFQ